MVGGYPRIASFIGSDSENTFSRPTGTLLRDPHTNKAIKDILNHVAGSMKLGCKLILDDMPTSQGLTGLEACTRQVLY